MASNDEEQPLLAEPVCDETTVLPAGHDQPYSTFGSAQVKPDIPVSEPEYTWKTILMIMSTWIGVFLASLDMSVMSTLTSPISESFGSFHLLTWFINAYTISSALIQPLSGKLSDIYGRRNCLLWANMAFLLGNLLCGLATEPWHFILGRAVGGLGGGCLHSISTFLASDVIPLRSRGFWQGVSNVAFAAGFSIGGTLGGLINDSVGWKWAFLFQPFPILVSMGFVFWLVPNSTVYRDLKRPSLKQIDFLGSATLTLAILTMMFGAVSGGNTFPWSSPFVYVPLVVSPLFIVAFGYVEEKVATDPVIPIRLLANRSVLGACVTNFMCTTANTAVMYYVPMIMEVKGLSAAEAGLRQIPNAIGAFVGSIGAGALMTRTGKYYWLLVGSLLTVVAAALITLLTLDQVTGWLPFMLLFLNGTGFGGMLVTTLLALVSAVDHRQHAVLTSASYAFRTAGNTMGITIAGAIFQNMFGQQLWARLGDRKDAASLIPAIRRRDIHPGDLPMSWQSAIFTSYDIAFHSVFAFILAAYVCGTLASSIIRENSLSRSLHQK